MSGFTIFMFTQVLTHCCSGIRPTSPCFSGLPDTPAPCWNRHMPEVSADVSDVSLKINRHVEYDRDIRIPTDRRSHQHPGSVTLFFTVMPLIEGSIFLRWRHERKQTSRRSRPRNISVPPPAPSPGIRLHVGRVSYVVTTDLSDFAERRKQVRYVSWPGPADVMFRRQKQPPFEGSV